MLATAYRWIELNFLALGRELRLSYLPPLMVCLAAGISGLTGIVGVFFVKDYLGLSAEFLAALGFWAGIPWALEMPLGYVIQDVVADAMTVEAVPRVDREGRPVAPARASRDWLPAVVEIPGGPFIAGLNRKERELAYRLDERAYVAPVARRDRGYGA